MSEITKYYDQSTLALAAYANLQPGADPTSFLEVVGMSATQAAQFASEWTVVDQFSDPSTGFSATVFERGGQRYLAIRGTQLNDPLDCTKINGVRLD